MKTLQTQSKSNKLKLTKITHIKIFKDLILNIDIKSCYIDDKLIDYKSINDYTLEELNTFLLDDKIKLSKKYIPLLYNKKINLDLCVKFTDKVQNVYLVNKNKFIDFNITHHSAEQLVKRMIYIYLHSEKIDLSKHTLNVYNKYLDDLIEMLLNEDIDETKLGNNDIIKEIVLQLLKDSEYQDVSSITRTRDRLAFTRRDRIHKNTNRYISYPFLFIMQDQVLKTVELYGKKQFDARYYNKVTSGDCKEMIQELLKGRK